MKRLLLAGLLFCCTGVVNGAERVLYFGASWCAPCRIMKRTLKDKEVKKELDKLDFVMYDVDKDKKEAAKYSIRSVPTLITIKDKKMRRYVGNLPKDKLLSILRQLKREKERATF